MHGLHERHGLHGRRERLRQERAERRDRRRGHRHRRGSGALRSVLALALATAALSSGAAQAQGQTQTQPQTQATIARPAPANAAQPRAVTDLASAVTQTAAVIEATVGELRNEYSDAEGPWTRVVLRDVVVHHGGLGGGGSKAAPPPAALELWQFGGVLPNGRLMVAAELPVFSAGQRYVLFLRNTAWNVSPIVGDLALRVERVGGAEVLVTSAGQAVVGVTAAGAVLGAEVFEPAPYDGRAAAAKKSAGGAPVAAAIGALDRAGFLAALDGQLGQLAKQQLVISGAALPRPAGMFRWKGQQVTPHGQGAAGNGDGAAGRDRSGGAR